MAKLQIRQCKVAGCGEYITGVFDTCITHSGLVLSGLPTTGAVKRTAPVVALTKKEKKKLEEAEKLKLPVFDAYWCSSIIHARFMISLENSRIDKRDGTCRIVSGHKEVFDICEDGHELLRLPFQMHEVGWSPEAAFILYEQFITDNFNDVFNLVVNKTIGTFVPVEKSRATIILTLLKNLL